MGNIHVKFYEIWTSDLGDAVLRYFLSGALSDLLLSGSEPFVQWW